MTDWAPSVLEGDNSDLCAPYLEALPVSGAAVSVFGGSMQETLVCASDAVSARLDELQFELGEGPRWEALRTRLPVLLPDVHSSTHPSWPVLGKALAGTGVRALFVFPLTVGAIDIGVVELYRPSPWELNHADQVVAGVLAGHTAWTLLRRLLAAQPSGDADPSQEARPLSRREVHQATGMVLAQTGLPAADALLLLRAHAFASGRTLLETAADVICRRLDFTPANGGNGGDYCSKVRPW